jgi:NitT/TauT family transport system ATP-binding protein
MTASPSPLMTVRALRKSYGGPQLPYPVIDGVSFAAAPGEFLVVVGPSGCGKTTLLMMLAGLSRPDAGEVAFRGRPLLGETPAGVAIVFQDYSRSLFPWKTNLANVLFGMRRRDGLSAAEKARAARSLLDDVGLAGFETHYPWQLSGGMQQRVAIARGLASQSELLLLDEPLAAVDAQTRADMQDLLLAIAKRYGQTCILVTHDVDEAVYMSDRIVVLSNRPTRVVREVPVELPKPRDQIETRETAVYLRLRHEVLSLIRAMRREQGAT